MVCINLYRKTLQININITTWKDINENEQSNNNTEQCALQYFM